MSSLYERALAAYAAKCAATRAEREQAEQAELARRRAILNTMATEMALVLVGELRLTAEELGTEPIEKREYRYSDRHWAYWGYSVTWQQDKLTFLYHKQDTVAYEASPGSWTITAACSNGHTLHRNGEPTLELVGELLHSVAQCAECRAGRWPVKEA